MKNKIMRLIQQDLVRGSFVVFVGTIAANALNYLFHLVTGRMLGPEKYAVVAALISLSYVIGFASQLINTILTQKIAALSASKDTAGIKGAVLAMGKNVLFLSTGIVALFTLLQRPIADFLNITDSMLIVLLAIGFAISLFVIVALALFQGQLKFFAHSIVTAVSSAIRVATAYVAIAAGFGVAGVMWGMVATSIVTVILSAAMMKKVFLVKARQIRLSTGAYASKIWIASALFGKSMLINVDVMLVKHFFPSYEAGLYAALATLGKIVLFFASSISITLLPVVSKMHAEGRSTRRELLLAQGLIAGLSLGILGAYIIMPRFIIGLLYGDEYTPVAGYLWLIGVYFMLYNISYTYINFFVARKERWILITPLVIAALQIAGISIAHDTIGRVLAVMISSAALLVSIFTYYFFAHDRKK